MKHFNKLVILFMTLAFMAAAITGCKGSVTPEDTTPKFTVTFDTDGGSAVAKKTVKEGEKASEPAAPTKAGYEFEGWFIGNTAYDFSTPVNSNITLTATWTIGNYVVTFDADNGQTNKTQIVKGFTTATRPATIPTKDGYTFIDWNYNGSPFDFNTPITSDITLTAEWIENVTIIIDVTSDNIVNTIQTLTSSRTLKATGYFDSSKISNINAALKTLYQSSPSILIRLDLSDTTGLTSLESINVTNSSTPVIDEEDKNKSFVECKNLETIILPETLTSIGSYAFYNCTKLAKIVIPESVTSIGNSAFLGCQALTETYFNGTKEEFTAILSDKYSNPCMCNSALYLNGSKENSSFIVIPDDTTSINDEEFENFTRIATITIPDSVTSIGFSAFGGCTGLTSITIPDSVTSIGWYAFSGCTGLTSITIPDSVTSIGDYAFIYCTGLTSITIPNSVTYLGMGAFYSCTGLTVYYSGTLAQWLANNMSSSPLEISAELYINNTKLEGSITIPNSVTSIGDGAFSLRTGLTGIIIPDSVTSIGDQAFQSCTGLTSITIPDSVTSIDSYAFSDCTGLTSITIPNSVTSIDYNAFSGCTGLTSVTFKNTNGWKDSVGYPVSVTDPEAAATLLKQGDELTRSN